MSKIPKYAARRDANEREIVEALRGAGATVMHLSSPGMPDLVVGFRDVTHLLEVKTVKGTLTEMEQVFFNTWEGQCAIVRSVSEALRVIGAIE